VPVPTTPTPPVAPTPTQAGTSTARRDQRGQSTVEYALILLGAAAVALAVVAWVTRTDLIGRLFDVVVGSILRQVT
jgi:Flp pilus assembly pilin Flp